MFLFSRSKRKKKGCLFYKTERQKRDFFISLSKFTKTDPVFFAEQYADLLPEEKAEYEQWKSNLKTYNK